MERGSLVRTRPGVILNVLISLIRRASAARNDRWGMVWTHSSSAVPRILNAKFYTLRNDRDELHFELEGAVGRNRSDRRWPVSQLCDQCTCQAPCLVLSYFRLRVLARFRLVSSEGLCLG